MCFFNQIAIKQGSLVNGHDVNLISACVKMITKSGALDNVQQRREIVDYVVLLVKDSELCFVPFCFSSLLFLVQKQSICEQR